MYKIRPPTKEIKYGIVFNNNDTNITYILDFILKKEINYMSNIFEKLNKGKRTVREGIDTDNMEYCKLSNFIGQTIRVDGFWISDKGNYGKQVVVVGNGWLINMPKRATEQFEAIIKNEDMLNAVLGGHLALTDIKPIKTNTGDTTSYTFTEV